MTNQREITVILLMAGQGSRMGCKEKAISVLSGKAFILFRPAKVLQLEQVQRNPFDSFQGR